MMVVAPIDYGGGYLTRDAARDLLRQVGMTNSDSPVWEEEQPTDIVGKYGVAKRTGNTIACVRERTLESEEVMVLVEMRRCAGDTFQVIAKERYHHGNHNCCWRNIDEGFKCKGGHFFLNVCSTGSYICERWTYAFDRVVPQDRLRGIRTGMDSRWEGDAIHLTSKMEFTNGCWTIHYQEMTGTVDNAGRWLDWKVREPSLRLGVIGIHWFTDDTLDRGIWAE